MAASSAVVPVTTGDDLYLILGVERTASADAIKSAYRKLAQKHHPDKSPVHQKEASTLKFQELTAAYTVLSDPIKRAKYDSRGLAALEPNEMEVTIDSSSLGVFSTFAAAMFTKLGVPLKTSVPARVLDQAERGTYSAKRMKFGDSLSDRAEKGQAQFYEIDVTAAEISQGFIIGARAPSGHKLKILLFEQTGTRRWELMEQEDSEPVEKQGSIASLFLTNSRTYIIPPKNALEAAQNPDKQLFSRLETLAPREQILIRPGRWLFAVYNDNWYNRAQYVVTAVLPNAQPAPKVAFTEMRAAEDMLSDLQCSIRAFQKEYQEAQDKWRAAKMKHDHLAEDVEDQLKQRRLAHYRILESSKPV